jgi:integrase
MNPVTDDQYATLRDALPDYLKPLFVTAYFTGVRQGELLAWQWEQVDWREGFITLKADETKSGHSRAVPILKGTCSNGAGMARSNAEGSSYVFNRDGKPIKSFRRGGGGSRTEVPRFAPHRRAQHLPRRSASSGKNAHLGTSDRFDGTPLQHRGC